MEIVRINIDSLVKNEGQIAGVPANPRQWTKGEVDRLAKSLKETPELFEMRPCLVYEQDGKYIVLGGNLRLEGAKKNKDKEVPCIMVPADTTTDKLKEIVIKDNGAFGSWDFDALANEWDDLPLTEWGVPAWETEEKEKTSTDKEEEIEPVALKWRIATQAISKHCAVLFEDKVVVRYVLEGEHYIDLDELIDLPKE